VFLAASQLLLDFRSWEDLKAWLSSLDQVACWGNLLKEFGGGKVGQAWALVW